MRIEKNIVIYLLGQETVCVGGGGGGGGGANIQEDSLKAR